MTKFVLDASAVIAVLYQERGARELTETLSGDTAVASISAVNLSEVLTKLLRDGVAEASAVALLGALHLEVHSFDKVDAYHASRLHEKVSFAGLSFGDRACLALAERHKLPVWTADRAWGRLALEVEIRMIRV